MDSSTVEHYTVNVGNRKYTASPKMVAKNKAGLFTGKDVRPFK